MVPVAGQLGGAALRAGISRVPLRRHKARRRAPLEARAAAARRLAARYARSRGATLTLREFTRCVGDHVSGLPTTRWLHAVAKAARCAAVAAPRAFYGEQGAQPRRERWWAVDDAEDLAALLVSVLGVGWEAPSDQRDALIIFCRFVAACELEARGSARCERGADDARYAYDAIAEFFAALPSACRPALRATEQRAAIAEAEEARAAADVRLDAACQEMADAKAIDLCVTDASSARVLGGATVARRLEALEALTEKLLGAAAALGRHVAELPVSAAALDLAAARRRAAVLWSQRCRLFQAGASISTALDGLAEGIFDQRELLPERAEAAWYPISKANAAALPGPPWRPDDGGAAPPPLAWSALHARLVSFRKRVVAARRGVEALDAALAGLLARLRDDRAGPRDGAAPQRESSETLVRRIRVLEAGLRASSLEPRGPQSDEAESHALEPAVRARARGAQSPEGRGELTAAQETLQLGLGADASLRLDARAAAATARRAAEAGRRREVEALTESDSPDISAVARHLVARWDDGVAADGDAECGLDAVVRLAVAWAARAAPLNYLALRHVRKGRDDWAFAEGADDAFDRLAALCEDASRATGGAPRRAAVTVARALAADALQRVVDRVVAAERPATPAETPPCDEAAALTPKTNDRLVQVASPRGGVFYAGGAYAARSFDGIADAPAPPQTMFDDAAPAPAPAPVPAPSTGTDEARGPWGSQPRRTRGVPAANAPAPAPSWLLAEAPAAAPGPAPAFFVSRGGEDVSPAVDIESSLALRVGRGIAALFSAGGGGAARGAARRRWVAAARSAAREAPVPLDAAVLAVFISRGGNVAAANVFAAARAAFAHATAAAPGGAQRASPAADSGLRHARRSATRQGERDRRRCLRQAVDAALGHAPRPRRRRREDAALEADVALEDSPREDAALGDAALEDAPRGAAPREDAALEDAPNEAATREDAALEDVARVAALVAAVSADATLASAALDASGCRVLHNAALRGDVDGILHLKRHGADEARRDFDGRTPNDFARSTRVSRTLRGKPSDDPTAALSTAEDGPREAPHGADSPRGGAAGSGAAGSRAALRSVDWDVAVLSRARALEADFGAAVSELRLVTLYDVRHQRLFFRGADGRTFDEPVEAVVRFEACRGARDLFDALAAAQLERRAADVLRALVAEVVAESVDRWTSGAAARHRGRDAAKRAAPRRPAPAPFEDAVVEAPAPAPQEAPAAGRLEAPALAARIPRLLLASLRAGLDSADA
ncbi:hypothetical protein M885DRAFT_311018 [Pelagophyceae sp. CCMP2097]|nr:hypothetical protein M885DRAFT_311018 [Pelagophyceae sp. CCMP2097]